jgi:hypothetical protein
MKPWETNMVDTFQYWRFGDYKNFTSLKLLAAAMDVPPPKMILMEVWWVQCTGNKMTWIGLLSIARKMW